MNAAQAVASRQRSTSTKVKRSAEPGESLAAFVHGRTSLYHRQKTLHRNTACFSEADIDPIAEQLRDLAIDVTVH
jgi:hypothetical protein